MTCDSFIGSHVVKSVSREEMIDLFKKLRKSLKETTRFSRSEWAEMAERASRIPMPIEPEINIHLARVDGWMPKKYRGEKKK